MSGGTFHVHGPHDHELEHAQQHAAEGHGDAAHHGMSGAIRSAVVQAVDQLGERFWVGWPRVTRQDQSGYAAHW